MMMDGMGMMMWGALSLLLGLIVIFVFALAIAIAVRWAWRQNPTGGERALEILNGTQRARSARTSTKGSKRISSNVPFHQSCANVSTAKCQTKGDKHEDDMGGSPIKQR